jgi:hypothetical protein
LLIKAYGHGCRQVQNVDKNGFPRGLPKEAKIVHGFQTGDIVKAVVPSGKYEGVYVGRVAIRTRGSFIFYPKNGTRFDVNGKCCQPVHRTDGYGYHLGEQFGVAAACGK